MAAVAQHGRRTFSRSGSRALEQLALLGLGLDLELLVRLVHVRVVRRVGSEVLAPVVDQQLLPGGDLTDGLDPPDDFDLPFLLPPLMVVA